MLVLLQLLQHHQAAHSYRLLAALIVPLLIALQLINQPMIAQHLIIQEMTAILIS